jgi:AcrR family transcriptional regulator
LAYHHGNLRDGLLARAAEIIATAGIEAVSLRGLARDLGVSHAAPRRHFADRGALLGALAKAGFRRSVQVMNRGAEAAGADPVARYRALGRSYVEFARSEPALFRAINHPEIRRREDPELRSLEAEWFATLREGAAEAQRAGWHPEADLAALVALSISGAMGAAMVLSDETWLQRLGGGDADALADDVLDLLVDRTKLGVVDDVSSNESDHNVDRDSTSKDRRAS